MYKSKCLQNSFNKSLNFKHKKLQKHTWRYQLTCFLISSGCWLGTSLIENLPITLRGMTVFAPEPENAPRLVDKY